MCLNINIKNYWRWLVSSETDMSNFHPLEVVGRGSETQHQAGEKEIYYNSALYGLIVDQYNRILNHLSAGTVFRRQNRTSKD